VDAAMGCDPRADTTPMIKRKTTTLMFMEFIFS
jgi:hypothetical protein